MQTVASRLKSVLVEKLNELQSISISDYVFNVLHLCHLAFSVEHLMLCKQTFVWQIDVIRMIFLFPPIIILTCVETHDKYEGVGGIFCVSYD